MTKLLIVVMSFTFLGLYSMNVCAASRDKDVAFAFQKMMKKKIFFAHQSVGRNILDGIHDLSLINKTDIRIIGFGGPLAIDEPGFYHTEIGENGRPKEKIDDFYTRISEAKEKPDIAFLKFCFVDVTASTDIEDLFLYYKKVLHRLKNENPDMIIVHFTVPLKTNEISWKTRIKSFLGRDVWEYADNIKRNQYNQLLLQEYLGKEPVFDIAKFESMSRSGERETFTQANHDYLELNSEYSLDGGHLNDDGKRWIAEKLLLSLGSID